MDTQTTNMLHSYNSLLDGYETSFNNAIKERDEARANADHNGELYRLSQEELNQLKQAHNVLIKRFEELTPDREGIRHGEGSISATGDDQPAHQGLFNIMGGDMLEHLGNLLDHKREVSARTKYINKQFEGLGLRFDSRIVADIMEESHGVIITVDANQFESWNNDQWTIEATRDNTYVGDPWLVSEIIEGMDTVTSLKVGFDTIYIVVDESEL